MMKPVYIFILLTLAITGAKPSNITFKVSAPSTAVAGQQINLSYKINLEANADDFRIEGDIKNFDVLFGPKLSFNYSYYVSGEEKICDTVTTFLYILRVKSEGTFNIPVANVRVKNVTYTSDSPTVKVFSKDDAKDIETGSFEELSESEVFVLTDMPQYRVFEQDSFMVTFKLYSKYTGVGFTDLKFPEQEDFLLREIELPQKDEDDFKKENHNGSDYLTFVINRTVFYPKHLGSLTIKPGNVEVIMNVPVMQENNIFENFFGSYRDRWIYKQLATNPVTVEVLPLSSSKTASL